MRRFRADWVWLPEGPIRGGEVTVDDDGAIVKVRTAHTTGADAEELRGLLLPGLVNAHCHLELSDLRGKVPGGAGLSTWAQTLIARRRSPDDDSMEAALAEAFTAGTAAIIDVTNSGAPMPLLHEAPLHGVAQIELIGIEPDRCEAALAHAARLQLAPGLPTRVTCHAVVSCAAALLAEVLAPPRDRPAPAATFHCDEDPADLDLLQERSGPWADFLDRLGRDWRDRIGQADTPVRLLEQLGVLGPHLALVHCVHTAPDDLDRLASTGTAVILCPRSNLHIGGSLPDVAGMVRRGIPLAIGTDSLASAPDLDPLQDAVVLARAFPEVHPEVFVHALTTGGARLLDQRAAIDPRGDGSARGGLVPGARHGLLHVELPSTGNPAAALLDGSPRPRRWLSCPLRPQA